MVNSGSLASEGDSDVNASFIQSNSSNNAVVQTSSSPITATGAVSHCKNNEGRLPTEVRAIEPTPAKTQVNSTPSPTTTPTSSTGGGGRLRCSLPLDKVQDVLGEQFMVRKPRKILCLYCERTFVNANLRAKHIDRCHSTKNNRRVSSRRNGQNITVTPCFHCDKLGSAEHTLKDLFRHLIDAHPTKYFGCLECQDRFLNQSHLNDHNGRVHNGLVDAKNHRLGIAKRESNRPNEIDNNSVRSKLRPRNDESTTSKVEARKTARGKRGLKMALKRSKRLQAQNNTNNGKSPDSTNAKKTKTTGGKQKKDGRKVDDGLSQSPNKATMVNPYPEFDSFFRVKKITDHSIDNLKISSLTFDDVFDKAFFNRIRCNIQENLQHHIDGKLFKNEESENRISNFERTSNTIEEVQTDPENFGCELSLNAATPAASLLSSIQFGEDLESQIEYGAKPSKKKPPNQVFYKYLTRRKYQASILEHKENRDMSKLDMWTQYAVKKRQQALMDSKKTPEQLAEFIAGGEYQSQRKREELNRILDRRGQFEDLREEVTKKAALERNEPEHIAREAEISELLSDLVEQVAEVIESLPKPLVDHLDENLGDIPDYLNLKRRTSNFSEGEIDKSDKIALICSSQETEYLELPTNSVRGKHEKVELTGEWARARIYVCAACGLKLQNMKQLLEHKNISHQHVWVQHYEFVGNQSELYRHLSIPSLGKVGVLEETVPNKTWRRSEARACTKCSKLCNSLGELHRHILECGGDWTWMLARKKCKYRPFGTKSRRKRRGLVKRFNIQQKTEPSEKKTYKKSFDGPRPRPSDAETIERMLANLPPKRATRKVMSLKEGLINQRRTDPNNKQRVNKKESPANFKVPQQVNSPSTQPQINNKKKNGYRKSLRSLNKVLASRILDTNASLLVKRKLKKNLTNAASRITTRQKKDKVEEIPVITSSVSLPISTTDCDNNKRLISEEATPKRMSPRINLPNNKSADIKWFFPVRKNAPKSSPKRKTEPETLTSSGAAVGKKSRKETFSHLVKTLSLRSQKPLQTNNKRKSKSTLDRLKSSPPILTREEDILPAPASLTESFLGESGASMDEGPPRLEKITEVENVASVDPQPPADVAVPTDTYDPPPIINEEVAIFNRQNDEHLQAKELTKVDCEKKSSSVKKSMRKPARGLNDCIAMLTSKLGSGVVNKVADKVEDCSIFKLMPSPPHEEVVKPIVDIMKELAANKEEIIIERPIFKTCILKVPSVVFSTPKPTTTTTAAVEVIPPDLPPQEEIPSLILTDQEDDEEMVVENTAEDVKDDVVLSDQKPIEDTVELEDEVPLASLVKETEVFPSSEIVEDIECQMSIPPESLEVPEEIPPELPPTQEVVPEALPIEESPPQPKSSKKKKSKKSKVIKNDLPIEGEERLVNIQDVPTTPMVIDQAQVIDDLPMVDTTPVSLLQNGEIKENHCEVEEETRKRSIRSAKAKALENILDDALAELTESERNRELSLDDDYDSITTRKHRNRRILDEVVQVAVVEPVENISRDSPAKDCVDESETAKDECEGVLRRSSRRSSRKIASYNENDLLQNPVELEEPINKIETDEKEDEKKINSDDLFDLLKSAPEESEAIEKPSTFFNSFDELSSDEFLDSKFEVFDHLLEEIEDNLTSTMKLDDASDKKEETIQMMIEAEKIDVGINKPNSKSKTRRNKNKKKRRKIVEDTNSVSISVSLSDEAGTVESTISSEFFDKSVIDKSIYCDICEKSFRRTDTLNKHKRTLTHISKLSKIEAHEAEMKKTSEMNDINLFDILHNIDNNRSNSIDETSKFPVVSDNSRLKLADIINDVLNKPVIKLGVVEETSSVELKPEFGRLKSLGERKSFDQDELKTSPTRNNYGDVTAGTILGKQIALLENIIENRAAPTSLDYLDDVSSTSFSSMKIEYSPLPPEEEKTVNLIKPPQNQYEDISADCDDNKFRKVLNRDEELFLECCSLLKSGSEVSNYSKKSKLLKSRAEDEDEEKTKSDSDESRVATPLGDNYDRSDSDSNTISSDWGVRNNVEIVKSPIGDFCTSDSKKMLTKGAMKVFEGLKVSIPTDELNMTQVFSVSPKNHKKSTKRKKDDALGKTSDVYDFEETLDNSDVFAKPDFKSFRTTLSKCDEEVSTKPKTEQNLTKKKCMIMGRIFKNATKTRVDDEIRDLPIVDNAKLVEEFVFNCPEVAVDTVAPPVKPHVMTEEEMNAAFDRLVSSSTSATNDQVKKPPSKKKKCGKAKPRKRSRLNSGSTDEEFDLNLKKRKNSKDNCINLEQELKECIGVASRKSQRKCTSGKQNVLVEYWSSDESLFEALLESQVLEASNGANRVKSPESAAVPPILDEQYNELEINPAEVVRVVEVKKSKPLVNRKSVSKESSKVHQPAVDNCPTATITTISTSCSGSGSRRKRPNPLYHWSSSSEDESCDLIEVKPLRDGLDDYDDDDEDRPIHHGWIVGDSPKKLVTMLAQAKGKKCDVDGVKELGKRRH